MFERISRFRKEIMGNAILLIVICHSTLIIDNAAVSKMYDCIRQFSKIGVDLFFLMSGLGLYFSFSKDSNLLHFYRKRILRIIPQYAIFVVCWGIIAVDLSLESILGFVWRHSLVSFYLSGELSVWFVAAILLLYFLFPAVYWMLNKGESYVYFLCLAVYCASCAITASFSNGTPPRLINEVFLVRIPTFLVGIVVGKRIQNTQTEKRERMLWIYISGVVCMAILLLNMVTGNPYERWIERAVFMPTTVCIAIVLGALFEKADRRIKELLGALGSITLELYLTHERVLMVFDIYIPKSTAGSIFSNVTAVVIAVFLSKLLSANVNGLKSKYSKRHMME